jgi:UPF0716 protein FxsA
MFAKLLILFILVPILELAIFIALGDKIGLAPTLGIIVLTAILGAYLTKSQGIKALNKYQQALAQGKLPHDEVMDGLMILIAGAVLLTPGFLTDAIGFSLLIPPFRRVIKAVIKDRLRERANVVSQNVNAATQPFTQEGPARSDSPKVINVEVEVVDDHPDQS